MSWQGLSTHFIVDELAYDGLAICSLWAFKNVDVQGDSIVAFIGPCDIPNEHIVDHADLKAGATIYSPKMLHFIIEHFDNDLPLTVYRQRLFTALLHEYLLKQLAADTKLQRRGDDVFIADRKLTISIATSTRVSTKIHFGINVLTDGVPVPACGLQELGLDPVAVAHEMMNLYKLELESIVAARAKVRGVD